MAACSLAQAQAVGLQLAGTCEDRFVQLFKTAVLKGYCECVTTAVPLPGTACQAQAVGLQLLGTCSTGTAIVRCTNPSQYISTAGWPPAAWPRPRQWGCSC
jgi:hypothetical protein